jgi:hypothetical protein
VSLELVNTGSATWTSSKRNVEGSLWVEARLEGRRPQYLRLRASSFGESQRVKWVAADIGVWVLQPYLWAAGAFGEPLVVEVEPVRPRLPT